MSHPADHEPNDNSDDFSQRAAHRFLFSQGFGAEQPLAPSYPIGEVRKALWRTIQSAMGDEPRRTTPGEIMPGANDYLLHLLQHLDRLEQIRATEVNVSRLQFDAMEAQIQARRRIEEEQKLYLSSMDAAEIEAAVNLSAGESAVTLGAAQVAINACLVDSLTTPLPNPLPRAELGD